MIFSGRSRLRRAEKDVRSHDLICSASVAFWDAYLKGDVKAKIWLSEGGLTDMLGVDGILEKKLQPHTQ